MNDHDQAMNLRDALKELLEQTRHVEAAMREGGDTEAADVLDTARQCVVAALCGGEEAPNLNNIYLVGPNNHLRDE